MLDKKSPLLIISGPTASGKTATSLSLCEELKKRKQKAIIINCDSLLFYKELNIGTAKPSPEELELIEHQLINISSAKDPLNASSFKDLALKAIQQAHQKGKIPILTGGSAFYLRALIKGMGAVDSIPETIKNNLEELYKKEGILPIRTILKDHDRPSYDKIHENDHYRSLRAAQYWMANQKKFSDQKALLDKNDPYDFSKNDFPSWDILHLYLDLPKDEHWPYIQKRTSKMLEMGLIDEVQELLNHGFSGKEKPLLSIGYKEVQDFLNGLISTKEALEERISISTRQLAKSQRTFFQKITPKEEFHPLTEKTLINEKVFSFLTPYIGMKNEY
jgi:tRNA dimethylallyltransferase